jgi:putative redox protein
VVDLQWSGERRFKGRSGDVEVRLDSPPASGMTPVQALGFSLAGCMAIDIAEILRRGRADLRGLSAHLEAQRSSDHPKRLLAVDLLFVVEGAIPPDRVERALRLSLERYCSVWHSLRQDIELTTRFEITA